MITFGTEIQPLKSFLVLFKTRKLAFSIEVVRQSLVLLILILANVVKREVLIMSARILLE
mgnify:CR=1 FL=1